VIDLAEIEGACTEAFGLPRVHWDIVHKAMAKAHAEASHEQWSHVQRQWLLQLAAALGQGFDVLESEQFLMLTRGNGDWIPELLDGIHSQIVQLAGEPCCNASPARPVVVILAGDARYRQFTRFYREDGLPDQSIGQCIRDRFPLVAVPSLAGFKPVIAHELTHAYLAPLRLPRWLNEGAAQRIERLIAIRQRMDRNSTVRQRHRAFWKRVGIQAFWSGEAFKRRRVNDQVILAYQLSELLTTDLIEENAVAFQSFIRAARREDAADAAAVQHYDCALGEIMRCAVGDGDWSPHPELWNEKDAEEPVL